MVGIKQHAIKFCIDTAHRMKASVPTIVKYAKVELVPPKPTEIGEIRQGFSNICLAYKSKSYRNLSVKEAWLNTLITLEVIMWFFAGEIIGRGHLVGYHQKL
ncbi:hypothetical protein ACFE04_019844 [Oxalis oulophora]